MATCRHCDGEIVKEEGKRSRKFYCSHTCYERYNTRVKYYRDHEKTKERSRKNNAKQSTKDRYKRTIDSHKKWCKDNGLTITQYHEYGYTFLKNNPIVVELLVTSNKINHSRMTDDERKEYSRSWYQKNREKVLEKERRYRESNKEKIKEYQREYKLKKKKEKLENNFVD